MTRTKEKWATRARMTRANPDLEVRSVNEALNSPHFELMGIRDSLEIIPAIAVLNNSNQNTGFYITQ